MNKEYEILTVGSPFTLENMVNDYLSEGWKTIGGVSFSDNHNIFMQAMIKER